MRTRNNSPMKRIAAAVAAVAVLFGTAPAAAEPETPAAEVAEVSEEQSLPDVEATEQPTWTVANEDGTVSEVPPAQPKVRNRLQRC